jgi:hypothetical protein
MPYTLTWYAVGEALHLSLAGDLSLDEMSLINQHTTDILAIAERKLFLLIDVSALTSGYATVDHLRRTQKYMDHPKLEALVVIANSKLNRLIMLLAFNLARVPFFQFPNKEGAQEYMTRRGYSESPTSINAKAQGS